MKKIIFTISLVLILAISSFTAFAQDQIIVNIDSNKVEFNEEIGMPFIDENGRTQVPFRATLEKYGATVDWNVESSIAIATIGDTTVEVPVGENFILKNGEEIATDTVAVIVDGRTYLPIRPVIEAFGSEVQWDMGLNTVVITTEPIDAKGIFTEANNKSYEWENCDANVVIDMSMPVPDETGNVQTMDMKVNMYMTMFMNPLKAKISADMSMNVMGEEMIVPVMDMYMNVDEDSYTTYMGMNDGTDSITWMKSTVEDELFAELLNYDEETIKENKELTEKYIEDVKYFGKYTDESGKSLLRMEYTMSGDIYKDMFGEYVEELSNSTNEQELMTAEMLKSFVDGELGDLTFIVYIDEESGEIIKYEMDLGNMILSMVSGMTGIVGEIPEEELELLKEMKATMVMDILNINEAEDFEIPEDALNAPDVSEMELDTVPTPETEDASEVETETEETDSEEE